MAKIYIKSTWQDEILAGNERYNILEDGGANFKTSMQIALATAVVQAGTAVDAEKMNNLENGVDQLDTLLDAVNAAVQILSTGWVSIGTPVVYASDTTFTVSGEHTDVFQPGAKIWCKQGGVSKYFYVLASSYGSPNTTVTITGGSDYTLANAAITDAKISYQQIPQGFPDWFNWVPTVVGFSVLPTNATYKFRVDGRQVHFIVEQVDNGTSNATNLTITMPITNIIATGGTCGLLVDNGAVLTSSGRWFIGSNSATLFINKDMGTTPFTASGGKRARLQGYYSF